MKKFFRNTVIRLLTWEAKVALRHHKPKIVAVTGNVGKTSTKDAIHAVVSLAFEARKSEKSFNSEIGLPLAVLGLDNAWSSASGWAKNLWKGLWVAIGPSYRFPEWLVLEVGADHPGDIETATEWLKPDIAVLTRMSDIPVHVENFPDAQSVLEEKMYLAKALKPGGTIVWNLDDAQFQKALLDIDAKKATYGAAKGADVSVRETEALYDGSPLSLPRGQYGIFAVRNSTGSMHEARVELEGVVGDHLMHPVAAALCVGMVLDIDHAEEAFRHFDSPRGRMRILSGRQSSVVIDDTYNSSPLACIEALKSLKSLSVRGRRIAVLGDMKELGADSKRAHESVGRFAAQCVHTLVVVGELAKDIALGARSAGLSEDRILHFDDSTAAAEALSDLPRAGDAILVKGSQSVRMERVSKVLLSEPARAKELLVRQEEEWERR
ncbi:MAG TPA: UDP-N-acetylmuramoyl-tripeptide--D-alanyl-D-alanine ligase [Candidatus Paceibacterota bacterium]